MCEVISWLVCLRENAWFAESNKLWMSLAKISWAFFQNEQQVLKDLSISNTSGSTDCHKTVHNWEVKWLPLISALWWNFTSFFLQMIIVPLTKEP